MTVITSPSLSADAHRRRLQEELGLQAPPHVDPDTLAYPALPAYDAEQGGFPLNLPATSSSKALAVTLGSNKSACWFGARADGTEVWWTDGRSVATQIASTSAPTVSSSTVWTIEGAVHLSQPASTAGLLAQITGAYVGFDVNAGGTDATFRVYDGSTVHFLAGGLVAALGFGPNDQPWRWRWAVNGTSCDIDVSADGASWTTIVSGLSIAARPMAPVTLSTTFVSQALRGQYEFLRVRDGGVSDPIVAEFTPGLFPSGSRTNGATAVDEHGVTWTLTKPTTASTDEPRVVLPGPRRFVMPGVSGEHISTPDSAANSITGSIDVRAVGSLPNWQAPSGWQTAVGKWVATGNQRSYQVFVDTIGQLRFAYTSDGVTPIYAPSSSSPVPFAANQLGGIRATVVGTTVTYWTSVDNGETWQQLGTPVAIASTIAIFDSTAPVEVGAIGNGTGQLWAGEIAWAEVRSGIDGTVVSRFHVDDANPDAYTWVDSVTGQTNTVNHTTAAGYKVTLAEEGHSYLLVDGVNDFARIIGDMSVTDFDPTVGLTLIADVRVHNTATPGWGRVMSSAESVGDHGAAMLRLNATPAIYGRMSDGSVNAQVGDSTGDNITYGVRTRAIAAYGSSDHEFYTAGVSRESATVAVAAEPATELLHFGRRPDGAGPWCGELHGFAVIKRRLSGCDAVTISTEMGL